MENHDPGKGNRVEVPLRKLHLFLKSGTWQRPYLPKVEACGTGEPLGQVSVTLYTALCPRPPQYTHTHIVTIASVGLGYRRTGRGPLQGRVPGPQPICWFSLVLTTAISQGLRAEGLDFVESPELHWGHHDLEKLAGHGVVA